MELTVSNHCAGSKIFISVTVYALFHFISFLFNPKFLTFGCSACTELSLVNLLLV